MFREMIDEDKVLFDRAMQDLVTNLTNAREVKEARIMNGEPIGVASIQALQWYKSELDMCLRRLELQQTYSVAKWLLPKAQQ